jgi:ParB family chromosome partitioning protein
MSERSSQLKHISPDKIDRNPENPRLFFRTEEMETLMSSIRQYGIQVPVTVYADGQKYILIDGERRWRCALKLNLKTVPAIVQPKPTKLENLLLMFNIHALREQWDYLTIANKLPSVIELYKADHFGMEPTEGELSEITGLARGQIRRCRLLLDLPPPYRKILEEELSKPKAQQALSEDFFIEMERALKTVRGRVPGAITDLNKARDALIDKTRRKVIRNITDFRMLSKMATSVDNLGLTRSQVAHIIKQIVEPGNDISISATYAAHFEFGYDQRKIGINVSSLVNFLDSFESGKKFDLEDDLVGELRRLRASLERILNRVK